MSIVGKKRSILWQKQEEIVQLVASGKYATQILSQLGYAANSGNFQTLHRVVAALGLSIPRGRGIDTSAAVAKNTIPLEVILVKNSLYASKGQALKRRLIRAGLLIDRCYVENCPNPEPIWCGKKLVLPLDHINGDRNDNRIENLRVICPNCHSQTATFCSSGNRKTRYCSCGKSVAKRSTKCRKCSNRTMLRTHKIHWPPVEEIVELVQASNFCQAGEKLGVSDNAVRKHLIARGINVKSLGRSAKLESRSRL